MMYISHPEISAIGAGIEQLNVQASDSILLLIAEQNAPNLDELVRVLSEKGISFFGGLFPALIYGDEKYEEGIILQKFPVFNKPLVIQGLDKRDFSLENLPQIDSEGYQLSALILLDGMTGNISLFFSRLYNHFGNSINYLGGGAGSLSLVQKPCLFTEEGVFENAAIITLIRMKSRLGVKHGWQTLAGPFLATDTHNNILRELNWKNAFEVYQETIEKSAQQTITADNFFDISKGFPFGIHKTGSESIVRDPISVNDQSELVCVGEIPENAALMILEGQPENLINAAAEATQIALGASQPSTYDILLFDCISRVLFLEDHFKEELKAVKQELKPDICPFGALTLGEISSYGDGHIEFFNKTIVVGMLYKETEG
ncbi:MAG: FIST C-terminal domain-containing protein [Microscillaceae bacterium]|nr:FIST C-terminal domain-containing protein [Microscillaceae bacterium]